MAIQFACPGCQQPIEVDDEWAHRQVACPYCRRTITAPAASTIDRLSPPVAKPLGNVEQVEGLADAPYGAAAPYGPPGVGVAEGNPYAVWALVASLLAVLCLVGVGILTVTQMMGAVEPGSSVEEMQDSIAELQKQWMEDAQKGKIPPVALGLSVGACGMVITWAAGLVLTILALRRRARRGMAVAALVIISLLALYVCISLIIQL
ncbi:MAG: hypothetical protein JXB13_01740 [Phycisphaerae bacterium]|nr:hypothetical protein [Phycisphaerae bacterium]